MVIAFRLPSAGKPFLNAPETYFVYNYGNNLCIYMSIPLPLRVNVTIG